MIVILYDGECSFCSATIQFVLKRDREELFHFAAIQSEAGSGANEGAPVIEVVKDSSAASAGVKKKDVIIKFNGQDVPNFDRLRFLIFSCKVGDAVEFVVRRDGKEISLKGVLGKFPGGR